ncbi:MAG: DUF1549 domain-containing protein, partial [Pirellulaceae bacterium]
MVKRCERQSVRPCWVCSSWPTWMVTAGLLAVGLAGGAGAQEPPTGAGPDFAREIRPILSEHCFRCHGPDESHREGSLRLDVEADAKRVVDGSAAIVPGDLERSQLWQRVRATDLDLRMPPPEAGRALNDDELARLANWIRRGADWQQHWSFVPPRAAPLPVLRDSTWVRNPIDAFVLERAAAAELTPQPDADPERLLRRVTLDLTGLPPEPAELDAFLADDRPGAYERAVDRLLASPRFGERFAWPWLDGARYADTSGYQNDGPRSMWRWRDWVIEALNQGMPFDQFTIEQIAGDLLPGATRAQRIATGFNRNHRGNSEGGIIPEEYQVEYVVDRVDTTCTVWLGLTMGCARCHDHKYDPIAQREFYQVFAYFNNVPEFGRAIKEGNSPPYLAAPTPEQDRQLARLDGEIQAAEREWHRRQGELEAAQRTWEKGLPDGKPVRWNVPDGLALSLDFDQQSGQATATGRLGQALVCDGQRTVDMADVAKFGYFDKFSVSLWVHPGAEAGTGTPVSKMTVVEQADGWYLRLQDGRPQVHLVKRWLDDAIRVESLQPIPRGTWSHLVFTYDGSRQARGVRVYCNGQPLPLRVHLDLLNQTFAVTQPLRVGGGNGPGDRWQGKLDELRIYERCVDADEVRMLATAESVEQIVRMPMHQRTRGQREKLRAAYLATAAPSEIRGLARRREELRRARLHLVENLPTVMVMAERPVPRETHVLHRGEYDKPRERVAAGLPECLATGATAASATRLDFARWLVSPDNPLTARVTVNRLWQMCLGAGLVRSTEDFGVQGTPPSHPELLDWLAVEFAHGGWDVKRLLRTIVCSSTYRQSAVADSAAIARDPENVWLARGARFRLPAEMIRDQALAASG